MQSLKTNIDVYCLLGFSQNSTSKYPFRGYKILLTIGTVLRHVILSRPAALGSRAANSINCWSFKKFLRWKNHSYWELNKGSSSFLHMNYLFRSMFSSLYLRLFAKPKGFYQIKQFLSSYESKWKELWCWHTRAWTSTTVGYACTLFSACSFL